MKPAVSKLFRSLQVHFPHLQDYRFDLQRNIRTFLNRTHEKDFELLRHLPKTENNLFIDVGANRGDAIHSILMTRPDTVVFAFEPNTFLIQKLIKIYAKDPRVTIYNCGLGNEQTQFDLFIPFYNNYMFDGLASFKEENARDWLKGRLYGFTEQKLQLKKINCSVKRLDDFSLKPYFIKIDVQGFEYEVLSGAIDTLKQARPILLIETPGAKEINFLAALGYKSFVFENQKLMSGHKSHLNVFFIPEEAVHTLKDMVHSTVALAAA